MYLTKRVLSVAALLLTAAMLVSVAAGCAPNNGDMPTPEPTPTPTPTNSAGSSASNAISINFKPDFNKAGGDYVPIDIIASCTDYSIDPSLANVTNLEQFPNLTAEQISKLASNGFVVAPGKQEQLFFIYEDNTYKKIPSFVTTDSVLQVYHIFYDYAIRSAEGMTLLPELLTLNNNMLAQMRREYDAISAPDVKAEALTALGYFGVAQLALGEALPSDFPAEILPLVEREAELLHAAGGMLDSPLFGYKIDYSLMKPRGHYTRSPELERYFRCMSWYGTVPIPLYISSTPPVRDVPSAMRSIIISAALSRLPEADGGALWENIYSTTSFFVGAADDVTPFRIAEIVYKVFGDTPDLNELADPNKLDLFYAELDTLPLPQINSKTKSMELPDTLQLRFMGQRYIPDSEILQELSDSAFRPFPTGLDVFATLGSARAAALIAEFYKPTDTWQEYGENFERMTAKFASLPDSMWRSNMYFAWLWTQSSLTGEYGAGYPMFMQNTAWQDKSLATALGSWAEMRHDTILYAKGSAAECGDGDVNPPPVVRSYVEPNPELYNRLLWLTTYSRVNLRARGILPENIDYAAQSFENMLAFLRDCSIKELRGEDLTTEEYDSLLTYGGLLEHLTISSVGNVFSGWYEIESEADRNMAVIADVHTVLDAYLEEAVGAAAEIYVIVPMNGELYLTRGAVFDYFEFISSERMTDEAWQAMLKDGAPERPPFTSSFQAGEAQTVPAPLVPYSTGC
ncbi:MAG: DUF3160 domain-containing protein [Oscillospiraceae bacterium]|jgi:hypothetical protein|nr:DUF3160 domain-containing protein [Oscillospiraceae bacterium]